jgi:SAM-dependent methyltransferase
MSQRTDEWVNLDAEALRYHTAQWEMPKRSTVAFERFCREEIRGSSRVIDLGAGAGACTAFLAERHPSTRFTAFEYSPDLVEIGRRIGAERKASNLEFRQGDWYDIQCNDAFDGVVSLQTLSWLPEHESALRVIFERIRPRWVGLSSLFHEGDISCRIEVDEHQRGRKVFYNVYSLPAIGRFCRQHGYVLERFERFEIDVDLPKPGNPDQMGTYTRRVVAEHGGGAERLQFSGPLLMTWYMVMIKRAECEAGPVPTAAAEDR